MKHKAVPISDPNFVGQTASRFNQQQQLTQQPGTTNLLEIEDQAQQVVMEHVQTDQIDEPLEGGETYYMQDTEGQEQAELDGGEVSEGEESVYMIQGKVCRKIQIEGESEQYLIDPEGRIYDMRANFIGTTTKECLEELGYPAAEDPETDEDPQFYEDQAQ